MRTAALGILVALISACAGTPETPAEVQAVPQKTVGAWVLAPIGTKSLSHSGQGRSTCCVFSTRNVA